MSSLLFLGVLAVVISLAVTPLVRDLFRRLNILDYPDQDRKRHLQPVPRVGGLAIVISYGLAFVALLSTHSSGAGLVRSALPVIWKLLPAAVFVFLTGLVDDIFNLPAWYKFGGQLAGAVMAYVAGIHISTIGSIDTPGGAHLLNWWSCPVTLLWLMACMNALNLIDGLDGLAAGLGLVASSTTLLVALIQRNVPLAFAILPLAGCLLGFLCYNFNPATIFLGDSGSLFVGFLLGCFAVIWSEKSATLLGMAAPLMALSIPLLDILLAIGRRFLRGQPLFTPDRAHIHHRLLDLGLTPRQVALLLYGLCAIFALLSLLLANHCNEFLTVGVFCIAVWTGIRRLHYIEFDVAGRALSEGWLHRLISGQISLRHFELELAAAETAEQCWSVLRNSYREFGFLAISVRLGNRTYCDTCHRGERCFWTVEIPLSASGHIWLGARKSKTLQPASTPYVDAIRSVLEAKLTSLSASSADSAVPLRRGLAAE
jgi:UDP-GlcNAc:undecaprenyl-phosphate/decaprenyl-phosphate GlcNAc-1-phosphate transferase